jgi:hypothetical protein
MNFSCASISLRAADADLTRHVEHKTRSLQCEHLDVPLSHLHMVAVPCHGTLHDLAVHARIAAKLTLACPLFKIEEIAEELEGLELAEQLETEGAAEMSFQ